MRCCYEARRPPSIPAAPEIAERLEAVAGDRDRILEFDEATPHARGSSRSR